MLRDVRPLPRSALNDSSYHASAPLPGEKYSDEEDEEESVAGPLPLGTSDLDIPAHCIHQDADGEIEDENEHKAGSQPVVYRHAPLDYAQGKSHLYCQKIMIFTGI